MIFYWLITLILIAATWKFLTFNNSELVHYPQYLPFGVLLVALTHSPGEAIAWTVLTGGLDECHQYWALHGGWGVPYDFNDIYMDLLGGALGVVLGLAFLPLRAAKVEDRDGFLLRLIGKPGVLLILAIAASGVVLWALGLMQLYQSPAPHWFALSRLKPMRQVPSRLTSNHGTTVQSLKVKRDRLSRFLPDQVSIPNQTRRLGDRNLNLAALKMNHRTVVIDIRNEIQIERKVGI